MRIAEPRRQVLGIGFFRWLPIYFMWEVQTGRLLRIWNLSALLSTVSADEPDEAGDAPLPVVAVDFTHFAVGNGLKSRAFGKCGTSDSGSMLSRCWLRIEGRLRNHQRCHPRHPRLHLDYPIRTRIPRQEPATPPQRLSFGFWRLMAIVLTWSGAT